jgi:hypothetical protein
MQLIHSLHFFTVNNVIHKPPEEKIQRSQISRIRGTREWIPSSYPNNRKLPVQKHIKTVVK